MKITAIATEKAPQAIGPYSQALTVSGVVFCSGQIPLVPGTPNLVAGGIREQTEQVLRNLSAVLHNAGSSPSRVLKTTIFLKDLNDFGAVNEVYAAFFGAHRPARSTVEVARLPKDALVEIDCIALSDDRE